jgi:hypothetical protein
VAHSTPIITRRDTKRQAWLDWLYEHHCFRFQVQGFFVTFRCEVQRRYQYWYAYKRIDGHLHKCYAGRSEDLTYDRLVEIVETLRYL